MTSPLAAGALPPDESPAVRLAKECGAEDHFRSIDGHGWEECLSFSPTEFAAFVQRIQEEQRERDARICEGEQEYDQYASAVARRCAAAIRKGEPHA